MIPLAIRIAADCPKCGSDITVRRRRSDGERFVSCTRYPSCKFACDYDPVIGELDQAINDLQNQVRSGGNSSSADLSRELRSTAALAHPDRWPGAQQLAHEITARINALREKLK